MSRFCSERFEERDWFPEPCDEGFAYAERVQREIEEDGSAIVFWCQLAGIALAGVCIIFWALTAPTVGG